MIKVTYRCENCYKEVSQEILEDDAFLKESQLRIAHGDLSNTYPLTKLHQCSPDRPLSAIGFAYPVKVEFIEEVIPDDQTGV